MKKPTVVAGLICLCLLGAPQAWGQSASELGAGAVSGYAMVKAFATVCKFEIEKPIASVLDANIQAIVAKFKIPGGALDAITKDHIKQLSGHDTETCVWGTDKFNAMISEMAKGPLQAAAQAGVPQSPIPPSKRPLASFPPDAPADQAKSKAENGIGGYIAIMAIGKLCNLTLDPVSTQTIVGNINALQPAAKLTDQQLDGILASSVAAFGIDKAKYCGPGQAGYNQAAIGMAKAAMAEAEGSGIALKPLGTASAPAVAVAAAPPTQLITGSDADAIATLARSYGEATLSKDKGGDPVVKGKAKGTSWSISFYGCEKGTDCSSIELYSAFTIEPKPTAAKINEWNQTKRWGRAYLDKDGDPAISYDVNLRGGVPRTNLDATISRWVELIGEYRAFVSKK